MFTTQEVQLPSPVPDPRHYPTLRFMLKCEHFVTKLSLFKKMQGWVDI